MVKQNHIQNFHDFLLSNADIKTGFERVCISRKVPKGNTIVDQDQGGQDMFLLREGAAKVVIYSKGGHEVQLAEFTGGTLFGEMAVLLGTARSSNVVALQQTSQKLFESHAFTVPQRLYQHILRRSEPTPISAEIYRLSPVPSVTSLSEGLNVSREATSRAVTKLISRGLVKKEKAYWQVLRPDFNHI